MTTTVDRHVAVATVPSVGVTLKGVEGSFTLDEGYSPYCVARFSAALPDQATRALLDLRAGSLTLVVTVTREFFQPTRVAIARTFTLVMTERVFDHKNNRLEITAQSGEALLHQDARVASTDYSPGSTDVKTIVTYLLGRIGAVLVAGGATATVDVASTAWKPGVSAWDYISPMLQASNLRLWCDEAGLWRLEAPQRLAAGAVLLSAGATVIALDDRMSLDSDDWYDAVVVTYSWADGSGVSHTAYDFAGATMPRSIKRVAINAPKPAAGAAAGILGRAQGRGRVLSTTAESDYSVTPGQPASVTPPGTDVQSGFVASVVWGLPSGEMTVNTRGLVDTPATAWLFTPVGQSWNSQAVGASWLADV